MTINEDGAISFANSIRADTFRKSSTTYFEKQKISKKVKTENSENDVIYKSVSVVIDFQCEYDNVYMGIKANNIAVSGSNVETDVEDGGGAFTFTLQQYRDSNFTVATQPSDVTKIGSKLYFQLAMENPVSGLSYSLIGEKF